MEYSEFKKLFNAAFDERINESIESTADFRDELGLSEVAAYFDSVSDLITILGHELEGVDYRLDLSSAYFLMSAMIEHAADLGLIDGGDDWENISAYFAARGDEFSGQGSATRVSNVTENRLKWTNLIDILNRTIHLNSAEMIKDGEFTIDEKILLVRMLVIKLRNRRVLDYKDLWVKDLLMALDDDWRNHGGGFGSGTGGGSKPWSHPGR